MVYNKNQREGTLTLLKENLHLYRYWIYSKIAMIQKAREAASSTLDGYLPLLRLVR